MILCNSCVPVNLSVALPCPALNLGLLEYILSDSRFGRPNQSEKASADHQLRREAEGIDAFGQQVAPSLSSRPPFTHPPADPCFSEQPDNAIAPRSTDRHDWRRIWVPPQERPGSGDGRGLLSNLPHDFSSDRLQRKVLVIPSFLLIFELISPISCASLHTLSHVNYLVRFDDN